MADLGFVEAFAKFGAKPVNPMWAVSAIAEDGALVLSCWNHHFKSGGKGVLVYVDCLSQWGNNELGSNLLKMHLQRAVSENLPVRMVVAMTRETEYVDAGNDASKVRKTFHVREDLIGRVVCFDGDDYSIEFRRNQ